MRLGEVGERNAKNYTNTKKYRKNKNGVLSLAL
jgi:hypothetical protein